jgi:beta-mannosidase
MKKMLNGAWLFKEVNGEEWLGATVPGCNYLDLLRLGKIPDPFDGLNEKDVLWVAQKDWTYKKTFTVDAAELKADQVNLVCEMLDTVCDVYVNSKLAGKGENAHLKYSFDIKPFVSAGENTVEVIFYSPLRYIEEKQSKEKCPKNYGGIDGVPHIRKPQCHFGWDWGPVLPPSGISGNIFIEWIDKAKISDVSIEQSHQNGAVELSIAAQIENYSNGALYYTVKVVHPNGQVSEATGSCQTGISANIIIEKPELWWTNDLSGKKEQPLYTVKIAVADGETIVDEAERTIGLRTITLNRERDEYGSNFQFVLNGVPLFIKGANWIPADSFINRFIPEKLAYLIDASLFSNLNMLRVWGGGYYESDAFYAMCDKAGILVWQDFAFACKPYPFFDDAFLTNVFKEVECNVKRLRHHACLALWCGNNEIEQLAVSWKHKKKYVEWTEKFFYHILENNIRKFDRVTPYTPGSPCGVKHNDGFNEDNVGDTHLWAVWHGLQPLTYYRKRLTRFCSEFGFESLPDIKTIERFAKPEDYSLTSEVFTAHQKCMSGNKKMVYYIASRFRLPKNFVDFIYLSQIAQQECVADATEHWRRNKGRCNGAMYWQLNDCWPVCSWASMDYYGNYKALQYTARHFNAPLSVSIENSKDNIKIYVLNDKTADFEGEVRVGLFYFEKGIFESHEEQIKVPKLKNAVVFDLPLAETIKKYGKMKIGLFAELTAGGETISRKTVLFAKENRLNLPKTEIAVKTAVKNDRLEITLSADKYARFVRVESSCSTLPFSDNYFDLLPGESKIVTQAIDSGFDIETQAKSIETFSCADVEPKSTLAADFFERLKVMLRPVNLGGWFYFRRIPKGHKFDK